MRGIASAMTPSTTITPPAMMLLTMMLTSSVVLAITHCATMIHTPRIGSTQLNPCAREYADPRSSASSVAGGTSSGKTTLANALLAEIAATGDRVLVLEDTVELQCVARDHVPLRTLPGIVSMTELVRATMRLRPDRVIVGEVRGGEALDLVKVWGTGHPGGIATVHAGSAHGALLRLEQLILEVAVTPPRALIAEAVNVVVFIAGRGRARRIQDIARVVGFDERGYRLDAALGAPPSSQPFSPATPGVAS